MQKLFDLLLREVNLPILFSDPTKRETDPSTIIWGAFWFYLPAVTFFEDVFDEPITAFVCASVYIFLASIMAYRFFSKPSNYSNDGSYSARGGQLTIVLLYVIYAYVLTLYACMLLTLLGFIKFEF